MWLTVFITACLRLTNALPTTDEADTQDGLIPAGIPQGYHLPPLIPQVPGVTELLVDVAPPLPILQIPTPALPNPGYIGSNIRPRKIGFFWTSAGDNQHSDFLVRHICYMTILGSFMLILLR